MAVDKSSAEYAKGRSDLLAALVGYTKLPNVAGWDSEAGSFTIVNGLGQNVMLKCPANFDKIGATAWFSGAFDTYQSLGGVYVNYPAEHRGQGGVPININSGNTPVANTPYNSQTDGKTLPTSVTKQSDLYVGALITPANSDSSVTRANGSSSVPIRNSTTVTASASVSGSPIVKSIFVALGGYVILKLLKKI